MTGRKRGPDIPAALENAAAKIARLGAQGKADHTLVLPPGTALPEDAAERLTVNLAAKGYDRSIVERDDDGGERLHVRLAPMRRQFPDTTDGNAAQRAWAESLQALGYRQESMARLPIPGGRLLDTAVWRYTMALD